MCLCVICVCACCMCYKSACAQACIETREDSIKSPVLVYPTFLRLSL